MPPKVATPHRVTKRALAKKNVTVGNRHEDDDVHKEKPVHKGPSMELKAIKAREKALVDKVALVTSKVDSILEKDDGVYVDCFHHVPCRNAPLDKNTFDYVHLLKLVSPMPFVLVRQAKLDGGPYAGHVALVLKQSLPFPLLKLPASVRAKVLNFLLKHEEDDVRMTLTQSSKKTAYCPGYKHRNNLAILATCKELSNEAAHVIYGQKFRFPGTQVIVTFLLQIGQFRRFLVSIHSDTYNASSARTMFHLLAETQALDRLSFSHITSNEKPKTAANNLYGDALPWMMKVGQVHPTQALHILKFDSAAFHRREKDEEGHWRVLQWDGGEQQLFWKILKQKLEALGNK